MRAGLLGGSGSVHGHTHARTHAHTHTHTGNTTATPTPRGPTPVQVMGGRFRSVMPSDLSRVGAIARESLPAAGVEYATEANRVELARFFRRQGPAVAQPLPAAMWSVAELGLHVQQQGRAAAQGGPPPQPHPPSQVTARVCWGGAPLRSSHGPPACPPACPPRRDGCHHCGKRRGALVGDHMPPNKHVKEGLGAMQRSLYKVYKVPYLRQARRHLAASTACASAARTLRRAAFLVSRRFSRCPKGGCRPPAAACCHSSVAARPLVAACHDMSVSRRPRRAMTIAEQLARPPACLHIPAKPPEGDALRPCP